MDSPDFSNSRLHGKEESGYPLCDDLCLVNFLNCSLSILVNYGLINYIDIKAKCRHLQKIPEKRLCGTCLSV
jgi:hypothetical protein